MVFGSQKGVVWLFRIQPFCEDASQLLKATSVGFAPCMRMDFVPRCKPFKDSSLSGNPTGAVVHSNLSLIS